MSSSIKRHKNGKTECKVTFEDAKVQKAMQVAIATLGKNVKIDGFRPGHAPIEKIKAKLTEDAITEETIRSLLPETFDTLIKEYSIIPIIQPHVALETKEPLAITVTFIEMPEVTLKGVQKIKVPKNKVTVEKKEVDKMVSYILSQHQEVKISTKPAKEGDKITVDFYGEDENGKEIENTRSMNYSVVIGSKQLIPGFEEALIGLTPTAKKSFTVTFPEKYQAVHLQGKKAVFHATCVQVEEVQIPELTDEFAKQTLQTASKAAFIEEIEASMKVQEEEIEAKRRENLLFDELEKCVHIEIPDELITEEVRGIINEFSGQLERQGMTIDSWLEASKKTAEDAMKEFKANAKKRISLRLGMQALVKEKNVTVSQEEINQAVADITAKAPDNQKMSVVKQYIPGEDAYEQLLWQKKVEKVVNELLGQ